MQTAAGAAVETIGVAFIQDESNISDPPEGVGNDSKVEGTIAV